MTKRLAVTHTFADAPTKLSRCNTRAKPIRLTPDRFRLRVGNRISQPHMIIADRCFDLTQNCARGFKDLSPNGLLFQFVDR